jgi:Ni,Fe-hydrogenase III large subunit
VDRKGDKMKILLGTFRKDDEEYYIVQEDGVISIEMDPQDMYIANYSLAKSRDLIVVPEKSVKNGEGVFDFRYGPVTSGIGEAGVYHLYTYGERILSVEIDLSYKHRDIVKRMIGLDLEHGLKMAENICGNFAFSHSFAFSMAVESGVGKIIDSKSQRLRIIALELERIYNHLYVISQLAQAAAQKVFASHMSYLFEESLRLNKAFSGSRYLKNFNKIGGIKDFDDGKIQNLKTNIQKIVNDFRDLYDRSLVSGNFLDRLYSTTVLKVQDAVNFGITGPTLRAAGAKEDLRYEDKRYDDLKVPIRNDGDALSRMEVRAEEIFESERIILKECEKFNLDVEKSNDSNKGIGYAESPTGTIVYKVDVKNSILSDLYIVTPSFWGFNGLVNSLTGNVFTDFQFGVESFGINFADAAL